MAKFALKMEALKMRRKGMSIRDIARTLKIARSTSSLWCRDTPLSKNQIEKLHQSMVKGGYRGRLKGAQIQKEQKLTKIVRYEGDGLRAIRKLSERDLLLLGLGLHMGEGTKGGNRVGFTNSNPELVKIFISWMNKAFDVPYSQIYCRVMINEIHRKRETIVRKSWSKILRIPLQQFKRTVFTKAKTKKVYENYDNFLGTLAIQIARSSDLQYRILGLMKGLVYKLNGGNKPG